MPEIVKECPVCGETVAFESNEFYLKCSCGTPNTRKGALLPCPHCGKRHWSNKKEWTVCASYAQMRAAVEAGLSPPLPEGSTEPPPWDPDNMLWGSVRVIIQKRDNNTCQNDGCTEMGVEVHHIVPRIAGGSDNPANLVSLCSAHHLERHNAIGGGYQPHPMVSVAIRRDGLEGEERAALLAGDHPILEKIHHDQEWRTFPEKKRRLLTDIEAGAQQVLEVDG